MVAFQFLVVANQAIIDLASHIIYIEISVKLKKIKIYPQNLSSNLFFQKIDKPINLWAPLQVQSDSR